MNGMLTKAQEIRRLNIPGDVVEVGVGHGRTIVMLRDIFGYDRNAYGYDTFTGIPSCNIGKDESHLEPIGKEVGPEVPGWLAGQGVNVVVGIFPESASKPGMLPRSICFAHVDVDTYIGTKRALATIWPLMSIGGVIAVHDYHNQATPGVKNSVDEFALTVKGTSMTADSQHAYLRKTA